MICTFASDIVSPPKPKPSIPVSPIPLALRAIRIMLSSSTLSNKIDHSK